MSNENNLSSGYQGLKDRKLLYLLIFINLVPIGLMFLTSMLTGSKIRTMWMTPFYLFFGVLIVYIFQAQINLKKLNGFIAAFLILFIFSPFVYAYISITETDKRTDYLGKEIAIKVQYAWSKNYKEPINVVLGDEWVAGNLSYHLQSRPIWEGFITKDKLNSLSKFTCIDNICVGKRGKKIKILIPIYNDWESVIKLLENIELQSSQHWIDEFSVIILNDASTEDRPELLANLGNLKSVKIINMKENRGHARCNAAGLKYINEKEDFDYIIPMDGDGEDRPEELSLLIEKTKDQPGTVVTACRVKRSEGFIFKFCYLVHKYLIPSFYRTIYQIWKLYMPSQIYSE